MMTEQREDTKKDKIIPWYFVAFFAGLAVLNVIFVSLAVDSYPGLVTENAYEKGLAYNDMIEAKQVQDALGWHTKIMVTDNHKIKLFLNNHLGDFISGADIQAIIGRVINDDEDKILSFIESSNGYYETVESFSINGRWNLEAHIKWQNNNIQIKELVHIP